MNMPPEAIQNELFELRVLSGLHQGAALPLIGEHWSIGADDDRDLALHDTGVEPLHCELRRDGEAWQLKAEAGRIVDIEGHALSELHAGHTFALGNVWVCLCAADSPWPSLPAIIPHEAEDPTAERASADTSSLLRRRLLSKGTGITLGVLLGIVGSAWSLSRPLPVAATTTANSHEDAPAQAKDLRKSLNLDEATRQLKTMLSERLLNPVTIGRNANGLVLSGTLQNDAMLVYERMLQRFERDYRTSFTVHDQVSDGSAGLPFVITQIIGGPHGHLVMSDGRRLYVGDRLDGLRLVRIDDGRIQFDGKRQFEVSW